MPLVKIFSSRALGLNLSKIHTQWCALFNVPAPILQLVAQEGAETYPPNVVIDVRAKGNPERTGEKMESIARQMEEQLRAEGVREDIRVRMEVFDPSKLTTIHFENKSKL